MIEPVGGPNDAPELYKRCESNGEWRCEWCGRPGDLFTMTVKAVDGSRTIVDPCLCQICQGLLGFEHPWRRPTGKDRQAEDARANEALLAAQQLVKDALGRRTTRELDDLEAT